MIDEQWRGIGAGESFSFFTFRDHFHNFFRPYRAFEFRNTEILLTIERIEREIFDDVKIISNQRGSPPRRNYDGKKRAGRGKTLCVRDLRSFDRASQAEDTYNRRSKLSFQIELPVAVLEAAKRLAFANSKS